MTNDKWSKLATKESIEKATLKLKENLIDVLYFETGEEVKQKVLEMIPQGSEVMAMTSVTLEAIGLMKEISDSGRYVSIRKKIFSLDMKTQMPEIKKLRSLPDWAIGSVHAVTENGEVLIASATGSQIPAYVYGANHNIWVVGTQKIVKNIDEGIKRIYEHSLLLENERAKKAYGFGSVVNRILIFTKESARLAGRSTLIFVNQPLGF